MDTPFVYDKYVTGKCFVGRKKECDILSNLLVAGEHVVMYEPPKTGKMSVIQQTLMNMRSAGKQFVTACVDMFNVRTVEQFLIKFGTSVMRACLTTPDEFRDAVERHLDQTHFVFDRNRFYQEGEIVSMNWAPDAEDIRKMLQLPQKIAEERQIPLYVICREFQMVLMDKAGEDFLSAMEDVLKDRRGKPSASFIMIGSQVNAMKYIFAEKKYFYRQVVHLSLQT